jgi:hypothetical protein
MPTVECPLPYSPKPQNPDMNIPYGTTNETSERGHDARWCLVGLQRGQNVGAIIARMLASMPASTTHRFQSFPVRFFSHPSCAALEVMVICLASVGEPTTTRLSQRARGATAEVDWMTSSEKQQGTTRRTRHGGTLVRPPGCGRQEPPVLRRAGVRITSHARHEV